MYPGRRPLPTSLKILNGNNRYINKNEPRPKPIFNLEPPS